jgi:hypothetical protein
MPEEEEYQRSHQERKRGTQIPFFILINELNFERIENHTHAQAALRA